MYLAVKCLTSKGYSVNRMSITHPYDLLVNGAIKIDVKVSKRFYYSKDAFYHSFNLEKKYATCDLYFIYCLDDNDKIEKFLIIPGNKLKITQLSIGIKSSYDFYCDRWDLLCILDESFKKLEEF